MEPYFSAPSVCPICAGDAHFTFLENFKNDRTWSLYECDLCKVQFWLPLELEHIIEQYEYVAYEGKGKVLYEENAALMVRGYWNVAQFLKRFGKVSLGGKKLIDIGCGTGEFLYVAGQMGAVVEGIDFNKTAIGLARERFGLKDAVVADAYDFLSHRREYYDMVTSFEVIEHIPDPMRFFALVYDALKPGGQFAVSTPNRDRYWGHINPKTDNWDFPYAHLLRWDIGSLKDMMVGQGFALRFMAIEPATDWFLSKLRYLADMAIRRKSFEGDSASEKVREKMGFGPYTVLKRIVAGACSIPAIIMLKLFNLQGAHLFVVFEKVRKEV